MRALVFPRSGSNWTCGLSIAVAILFSLLTPSTVCAAAPVLDQVFPLVIAPGPSNALTVVGKFDPWPTSVWIDCAGITFHPLTNSGRFMVEVATNAPTGWHLMRCYNDQGASQPRFLMVNPETPLAETEPNDDFRKPNFMTNLPAQVNGRLEKGGDVDSFGVTLKRGQTLVAALEAHIVTSPLDAVLRLVDADGVQVAWNHDDGRTLDPLLTWTAPSDGSYVLQAFGFAFPAGSEVRFTGNNKCVYRLTLTTGQYLGHTLPLGAQRHTNTALTLVGWNMDREAVTNFVPTTLDVADDVPLTTCQAPNTVLLPLGDGPELLEREPNDSATDTNTMTIPGAVTGCINTPGDEDRFTVSAQKDETYLVEVQSARFGFPLDAKLRVENEKGEVVANADDNSGPDPRLEWTPSKAGSFVLAVSSVVRRGGPSYRYRLNIRRARPHFKATLTENQFSMAPGKTNEVKINVRRLYGLKAPLRIVADGLPAGVSAEPMEVSDKGGDTTLKLVTAPDAKPASGPFRINVELTRSEVVTGEVESEIHPVSASLVSSTVDNGVPGGFNKLVIESIADLWLTVLPPPPVKEQEKPKEGKG